MTDQPEVFTNVNVDDAVRKQHFKRAIELLYEAAHYVHRAGDIEFDNNGSRDWVNNGIISLVAKLETEVGE